MPNTRYIETVFESLEIAVEFGIIEKWSISGSDFVIHHGDEQTNVPSIEAADFLIDFFQQWDLASEESGSLQPDANVSSRTKSVENRSTDRDLARIELPRNSIHLVA